MENKKTKLTISGVAKKSIKNIELAKTQSKNAVVIEKKPNRFTNKSSFNKFSSSGHKGKSFMEPRSSGFSKHINPITNDFEKRKLAEQRATRRIKGEVPSGHVLVLGDNRANSWDGRYWPENGLLPEGEILGRAIWRFWPFHRIGNINFAD